MKIAPTLTLLLALACASAAEFKSGIAYTNIAGAPLLLDVKIPVGEGTFPVAILIHGGGWSGGDRRGEGDINPLMEPLTEAGVVWFSLDYRLAPSNRWPACLEDVQSAIRWVKAHAPEYRGDPSRIALIGYSAGGHLACHAAVLADDSTRVQAVIACAAPTDHVTDSERRGGLSKSLQALLHRPPELDAPTRATLRDMSPVNYVKPGLPPFLLVHGTADQSVPYAQSVAFQARLQRAGVSSELVTLTDAPHRLRDWKLSDADWQAKAVRWLTATLPPKQSR